MQNHIETAVMPLKQAAIARAVQFANEAIAEALAKLAENDWDLNRVAPRPNGNMNYADYAQAMAKIDFYERFTEAAKLSRRIGEPNTRIVSEKRTKLFLTDVEFSTAAAYDAFVAKLVYKIGDVTAATLEGDHVWGFSVLSVTLPNGTKQNWKTQQIVNFSKLGKVFNQWPSRKVK